MGCLRDVKLTPSSPFPYNILLSSGISDRIRVASCENQCFSICKNKGADQLGGEDAADQFCFVVTAQLTSSFVFAIYEGCLESFETVPIS